MRKLFRRYQKRAPEHKKRIPIEVVVTEEQAEEFLKAINATWRELNEYQLGFMYYYSNKFESIVIAFDSNQRPFFGYIHNLGTPSFCYRIHGRVEILDLIGEILKHVGRDFGWRAFLNSTEVFCWDRGYRIDLIHWKWPSGDLVHQVSDLYHNCWGKLFEKQKLLDNIMG